MRTRAGSAVGGTEGKDENGGNARTATRAGGSEGDNKGETASADVRAEAKIQTDRKKERQAYVKPIGMVHTCCIKTTINYVRAQLILLLMFVY